jgi:hypothetical protein
MVRLLLIALFAIALPSTGIASITAAWKVPIDRLAPDHDKNPKVHKLKKPPGESGFFQAGDELWDVSKLLDIFERGSDETFPDDPFEESPTQESPTREKDPDRVLPFPGDWAVWNARSGMLVARGNYSDLLHAQEACGYDNQPEAVRVTFELMKGDKMEPEQALGVLALSGVTVSAESEGMKIELESSMNNESGFHELRLAVSWPAPGKDRRWDVSTALTCRDGVRFPIARHGTGEESWSLFGTVVLEHPDGTMAKDSRWIETQPAGLRPWPVSISQREIVQLPVDDRRTIAWYRVPPDYTDLPPPRDLQAPADLEEWISGGFVDYLKVLGDNGVDTKSPGFFAGYDPDSSELVIVADSVNQQRILNLVKSVSVSPPTNIWVETNPDANTWGSMTRSGERAVIRLNETKTEIASFEVEPTSIRNGQLADLHCAVDVMEGGQRVSSFRFRTLVPEGNEQSFARSARAGVSKDFKIRADLIEP